MPEQRKDVIVRLAEPTEEPAPPLEESASRFWLGLVSLLVLALLPAVNVLTSRSPLPLDDAHFVNFGAIRLAGGVGKIWTSPSVSPQYLPLTYTTHWLEYAPHFRYARHDPPFGTARAVNAALHVLNVLLVWLLLRRLGVGGAWLAAALFATLPVQVETVAWVAQRPVLLSSLFVLLVAHVFVRFADLVPAPAGPSDQPWWSESKWLLGASLLAVFVAGLLSGSLALSLPLVLLLLAWWKGRVSRRTWVLSAMMLTLVAGWTALHWHHGLRGAELPGGDGWAASVRALATPWRFLGDVLFPCRLGFSESRSTGASALHWLGAAATVVVVTTLLLLRARVGRASLVAAVSFLLLLAPGLGWVPWPYMQLSDYASHVGYLAVVAVITPVGWLVWTWTQSRWSGRGLSPVFAAVAIVLVLVNGGMSLAVSSAYRDQRSLVDRQARLFPNSATARLQQARLELESETPELNRAEMLLREALELAPAHVPTILELARLFERRKDFEQALSLLEQAGQARPDDPDILLRVALIEVARGRSSVAKPMLERLRQREDIARALRLNVLNNLALLCQQRGELDEAEQLYRQAIELDPGFPASRINYANLLYALATRSGQVDQQRLELAVKQLEIVLELDPRNWTVWLNAGAMAGGLRDLENAERFLRVAVSLNPESVEAMRNLGQVLVLRASKESEPFIRARLLGDAVFLLRRAVERSPDSVELRRLLEHAETLAAEGRGG